MDAYTRGDTIPLVFATPYDINSNISESIKPHFRIGKALHQFGRKIYGLGNHFAAIQGTDYIESFTLWEGVCTYLFSFNDYVFRSEYVCSNKHSYNAPPSSNDDLQGASPLVFCRDCIDSLAHDHRVHNFFIKFFSKK